MTLWESETGNVNWAPPLCPHSTDWAGLWVPEVNLPSVCSRSGDEWSSLWGQLVSVAAEKPGRASRSPGGRLAGDGGVPDRGNSLCKSFGEKTKQPPGAHSRGAGKPGLTLRPREEGLREGGLYTACAACCQGQRTRMGSAGGGLGQKKGQACGSWRRGRRVRPGLQGSCWEGVWRLRAQGLTPTSGEPHPACPPALQGRCGHPAAGMGLPLLKAAFVRPLGLLFR